jgi:hypothetical protein
MESRIDPDTMLAEQTARILDRLRPHANAIVVAAGGVALALLAWALVSSQTAAGEARSWDAFLAAVASDSRPLLVESLGDVIRRHPDTPAARWSELLLADFAMSEGNDLLFTNTDQGRQRLRSAVEGYSAVLAARPRGLLASRATFGLAKARESLGELEEARRGYEAVAREHVAGGFATIAEERVEALGREGSRQWYDWFASQKFDPPPPVAAGAGAAPGVDQPAPPPAAAE